MSKLVRCKQAVGPLLAGAWYEADAESDDENTGAGYYFVQGMWRSKELFDGDVMTTPRFVRCKDNTLHRDLLTVGAVYECAGEREGNYLVLDRWLLKGRFTPATYEEWVNPDILPDRDCVILDGACDCPKAEGETFPVCQRYPVDSL